MTMNTQRTPAPRSAGPYVTPSGRRLPVRTLTTADLPGMLEFWDYSARRDDAPQILNVERASVEGVLAEPGNSVMAVMAGPRQLIRAVALWRMQTASAAQVEFSVDESVRADGVFVELIYRVADDVRAQGIRELRLDAPTGSEERAAVAASGFPVAHSSWPNEGIIVDISEAR